MNPDTFNGDIDSWIHDTLTRSYMTASEAMASRSKPSDILGMSVSSGMDPWAVKGHITTAWVDDLIKQPPTIKHLGRPKAKS